MKYPVEDITADTLARHCRYVADAWRRFGDAPAPERSLSRPDDEQLHAEPERVLRRYRQLQSVHILWQDLTGRADIEQTGQALAALAIECLDMALNVAESRVTERCGHLEDKDGRRRRLIVFGLGKLGGNELNFNSDIDLVFAHDARGRSSGPRRVEATDWMRRVAREVIALLDKVTADGRAWIVDTRLRPFGEAGALVWSLPAMEQYFLSEGRSWERYAWLKAWPVAGDVEAGQSLIESLEPFIYRRYLDYGIFESLRELHRRIDSGGQSDEREADIKRGRGGIREIEFLVQSLQILRGGREALLRERGFLPALEACAALGLIEPGQAGDLRSAYGFLRMVENRLQAMTGRQTHRLPEDEAGRRAMARLTGHEDWSGLASALEQWRERAREQFSERFREPETADTGDFWPPDARLAEQLGPLGFSDADAVAERLGKLHDTLARRPLSAEGRRRLERLMPQLIEQAGRLRVPTEALEDLLDLIEHISRRSAYLALLHERPETLARLVRVFATSHRVAEWIIGSPQLLDDLLDPVHDLELPVAPTIDRNDPEASLWALGRWRQAGFLRTALAELDGRMSASDAGRQLSFMAGIIVDRVLELVGGDEGLAVIGYGNLGAAQLHYRSDLDLVFLHREGEAPLRTVQRLIHSLEMPLPGGRLFDIDTRLRPNGRAGLLVSRIESFADYQRNKAWTWEHQALIRARWIAGDAGLKDRFDGVRSEVLRRPREAEKTAGDLADMRRRQRQARKEGRVRRLLVDLQFIAELGVLVNAADQPELIDSRDTPTQLQSLGACGWLDSDSAARCVEWWHRLLAERHLGWLRRESAGLDLELAKRDIGRVWASSFPGAGQ